MNQSLKILQALQQQKCLVSLAFFGQKPLLVHPTNPQFLLHFRHLLPVQQPPLTDPIPDRKSVPLPHPLFLASSQKLLVAVIFYSTPQTAGDDD